MEKSGQDLRSCEQLPIEIELPPEFVYRSIFACPVSRDQSSEGALPCQNDAWVTPRLCQLPVLHGCRC